MFYQKDDSTKRIVKNFRKVEKNIPYVNFRPFTAGVMLMVSINTESF